MTYIGQFILKNYKEAIDNVKNMEKALRTARKTLGIPSDATFEQWKAEEAAFLVLPSKNRSPYEEMALQYVLRIQELTRAT